MSIKAIKDRIQALINNINTKTGASDSTLTDAVERIIASGGSGGIDTSDATAVSGKILNGYTAYAKNQKITGTLPYTDSGNTYVYYNAEGESVVTKETAIRNSKNYLRLKNKIDADHAFVVGSTVGIDLLLSDFGDATAADVKAGKKFTSAEGLVIAGTHECAGGIDTSDATAATTDIVSGKTAYVNGEKITGTVKEATGTTILSNTTVPRVSSSNTEHTYNFSEDKLQRKNSKITIKTPLSKYGDATAEDVVSGKTFTSVEGVAVTGTHVCEGGIDTSDATATETDIANGKTAYVNGQKVTGTISEVTTGNTVSATSTEQSGSVVKLSLKFSSDKIFRKDSYVRLESNLTNFGNATAADVAKGKTFTSEAGVKVVGTMESGGTVESDDNCEAYIITSASDVLNFKRSQGTIKVWGYGFKSSGSYNNTIYAFVGDGYYSGASHGTPTKTSVTFGINSDGTLSGLPNGLTAMDIIVTKGI